MADGNLDNLFPPGNNGTAHGVGMITGNDGSSFVFQTPRDNNNSQLSLGPITYTLDASGKHIESVTQTTDNPLGGS